MFCHQCNFTCSRENVKSTVFLTEVGARTFLDATGVLRLDKLLKG